MSAGGGERGDALLMRYIVTDCRGITADGQGSLSLNDTERDSLLA